MTHINKSKRKTIHIQCELIIRRTFKTTVVLKSCSTLATNDVPSVQTNSSFNSIDLMTNETIGSLIRRSY